MIHPIVEQKMAFLGQLCEAHKIKNLYLFGSAVDGSFNDQVSDFDFLVRFQDGLRPEEAGQHLLTLQCELEDLFSRKVDLMIERPFRNPYFARSVEATKQIIYAA
nr:nucleotidyltransferase domain-containing protein [uncultured Arsenicibacter sp.]